MKIAECLITFLKGLPSRDDSESYFFEHLEYTLTLSNNFPAVRVKEIDNKLYIDRGYIYLRIAENLGLNKLTVIASSLDDRQWLDFCKLDSVNKLTREELYEREELESSIWHVVFFDEPIDKKKCDHLVTLINECLGEQGTTEYNYSNEKHLLEFKTPLLGEYYASKFLGTLNHINRDICKVLSYQGRKFDR